MIENKKIYTVKNRSASTVVYTLPEVGIRREFMPGEVKKNISYDELEKLSFRPGGKQIIANFLQILNTEVLEDLGVPTQPEYFMSEQDIATLITSGSIEEFLDFLDFAPVGNMDIMKKLAVSIPLADYTKRQALKEKTGFDVDTAIKNLEADKAEDTAAVAPKERRVQPKEEEKPAGRRTSGSKYTVIKKDTE